MGAEVVAYGLTGHPADPEPAATGYPEDAAQVSAAGVDLYVSAAGVEEELGNC